MIIERLKQRRDLRQQQSTRQLMGIDQLTEHGVKTSSGELVFYFIKPDNLSVMSQEGVRGRIVKLTNLLCSVDEMRLIAMDAYESFQSNKDYYQKRIAEENNPAVQELLQKDMEDLDKNQAMTAASREFLLVRKLDRKTSGEEKTLVEMENHMREQGFRIRLATRQDVMRLLAVYYQHDVVGETFENYDGEAYGHIPVEALKTPAKKSKSKKKKKKSGAKKPVERTKDFLDMIAPTAVQFNTDHFICGGSYRSVLALNGYPTSTEALALLRHIGVKSGVTLHIYVRKVTPAEERTIIDNAANKNRMEQSNTNKLQQSVTAGMNLQDVTDLIASKHRSPEPLLHCAVYLELAAQDADGLKSLRETVEQELNRIKLRADRVVLRQKEGFLSSNIAGSNVLGDRFERVLPASSVANLFPFNYSGKTDPHGFFIGEDLCGSNVIVDLERRDEDKTTGSALILGNSGQGKSYLQKLLICNVIESGKNVLCFDTEHELEDLCNALGGCFIDLTSGEYMINLLEPKLWNTDTETDGDRYTPQAFSQNSKLSQHISFLKDVFRSYKDFSDRHIDTIELMLERLYERCGMNDDTDFNVLKPTNYPIMSDLYDVIEEAYQNYEQEANPLYTAELLREVLLGLHSMCKGAESKFFNGHTNITSHRFIVFGVHDLVQTSGSLCNAMLLNVFSYFSNKLLVEGNTVAGLDELHVWISNKIAVGYIRNVLKRARKRDSSLILASQNLDDFMLPGIAELTRPLFAIPTHQFLFNGGNVEKTFFMSHLQLDEAEFEHIRHPQQGQCIYKCGNDRYLLKVVAPEYKSELFGAGGGK